MKIYIILIALLPLAAIGVDMYLNESNVSFLRDVASGELAEDGAATEGADTATALELKRRAAGVRLALDARRERHARDQRVERETDRGPRPAQAMTVRAGGAVRGRRAAGSARGCRRRGP